MLYYAHPTKPGCYIEESNDPAARERYADAMREWQADIEYDIRKMLDRQKAIRFIYLDLGASLSVGATSASHVYANPDRFTNGHARTFLNYLLIDNPAPFAPLMSVQFEGEKS